MELELITKEFPEMLSPLGRAGYYTWEEIDRAIQNWLEEERHLADLEDCYKKVELPKVRKSMGEWIAEIEAEHGDYVKCARERYLEQEVEKINEELSLAIEEGKKTDRLWKKRDNALRRVYFSKYKDAGITYTANEIEAARNVSFSHFLEVKKDFATCPFHEEKTASFHIRKNYGYCFGCLWKGDIINFIMDTEHLDFPKAVAFLLGR